MNSSGHHVPLATNTRKELLDASFSMRSVSYHRKVYGSVCVSGKHVPAATNSCWGRGFLCIPRLVEG
jgi:hypothetical protein